jgi:hypothetical protein
VENVNSSKELFIANLCDIHFETPPIKRTRALLKASYYKLWRKVEDKSKMTSIAVDLDSAYSVETAQSWLPKLASMAYRLPPEEVLEAIAMLLSNVEQRGRDSATSSLEGSLKKVFDSYSLLDTEVLR